MSPPPFTLSAPLDGASPLLLASPHCGTHVPDAARRLLCAPPAQWRRIEDAHVGRLVAAAAGRIGAPLLCATHSRVVIDLNRAETEYDPAMLRGRLATAAQPSERVRRGYGLIPRLAGGSQPIHAGPIPAADVARRIETLHRPWHRAITMGLAAARARHGHAILIDCHSMPPLEGAEPPVLVIGDRHGQSAHPALGRMLAALFGRAGLRSAANHPYAGGHSTSHHGRPGHGVHALQLEFCRTLYMDAETLEPLPGFAALSATIAGVLAAFAAALPDLLGGDGLALAAE